jgi:diacylglycerol kinase (ATP)
MWMIEEAINKNLNFDEFSIGILPFGTGNDFARATGNKKELKKNLK